MVCEILLSKTSGIRYQTPQAAYPVTATRAPEIGSGSSKTPAPRPQFSGFASKIRLCALLSYGQGAIRMHAADVYVLVLAETCPVQWVTLDVVH